MLAAAHVEASHEGSCVATVVRLRAEGKAGPLTPTVAWFGSMGVPNERGGRGGDSDRSTGVVLE